MTFSHRNSWTRSLTRFAFVWTRLNRDSWLKSSRSKRSISCLLHVWWFKKSRSKTWTISLLCALSKSSWLIVFRRFSENSTAAFPLRTWDRYLRVWKRAMSSQKSSTRTSRWDDVFGILVSCEKWKLCLVWSLRSTKALQLWFKLGSLSSSDTRVSKAQMTRSNSFSKWH